MKVYNRLFIVLFLVLMTNGVKGQTTPEELKYAFLSGDISADTLIVQNIDSFLNRAEIEEAVLVIASGHGFIEVCKTMIYRGSPVDFLFEGTSSLMIASFRGNKEIVKLLLDNGATVNLQSIEGDRYTALMQASQGGHEKIVKLLLDRGAKLDLQDTYGATALIYASLEGHIESVKILLDYGANLDLQNNYGKTALIWATQNGHSDVVKILLGKGANPDIKDNMGNTAVDYTVDD